MSMDVNPSKRYPMSKAIIDCAVCVEKKAVKKACIKANKS